MSQQTTMAVVVPRFLEFISVLPDVASLAHCPESTLRKLWAGLGYYARARNLQKGARHILDQYGGQFPRTRDEWLQVPGCGPYTAAVIASICFGEPVACVDGNVIRVVSRLRAERTSAVWTRDGLARIQQTVDQALPHAAPGHFNQAMMELGATVCRKQKPLCNDCPLSLCCQARAQGVAAECPPPKPRRTAVETRVIVRIAYDSQAQAVELTRRTKGFLCHTTGFPVLQADPLDSPGPKHPRFTHSITHHRITASVEIVPQSVDASARVALTDVSAHLGTSFDRKAWRLARELLRESGVKIQDSFSHGTV